jgi:hypothetical protein
MIDFDFGEFPDAETVLWFLRANKRGGLDSVQAATRFIASSNQWRTIGTLIEPEPEPEPEPEAEAEAEAEAEF